MIRFHNVNRPNSLGYDSSYQRHHLIPLQAASISRLSNSFDAMKLPRLSYDDFDTNGVLLPCDEIVALRTGQPLHRGPHPKYNELVLERLYLIMGLSSKIVDITKRRSFFRMRISLLQSALRHGLLQDGFKKLCLNNRDPIRSTRSFDDIDSRIDLLFTSTGWPLSPRNRVGH